MMDWTDRHDRFFLRTISRHAVLYTEMITTGALIHGDHKRYLAYHADEHPLALQLGGSDPADMATCAKMAEAAGYDEVNINVGCPSDRVQGASIGACLMATPEIVAECVAAMKNAVTIPVTVKHRIGIDDQDSVAALNHFIQRVSAAGCETFIVHARKAWLEGLSPKQNRDIPPLDYERIYQLKKNFPKLEIIINGGIKSIAATQQHLNCVDGVMMGREAYQNPYILATVDQAIFGAPCEIQSREEILQKMLNYIQQEQAKGAALNHITRHILGLYKGEYGGKSWRRVLSEKAHISGSGIEVIEEANQCLMP